MSARGSTPCISFHAFDDDAACAPSPTPTSRRCNRPRRRAPLARASARPRVPVIHTPSRQRDPHPRIDDEDRVTIEPLPAEWRRQPNAVVVQIVEEDVRVDADEGQRQRPPGVKRTVAIRAARALAAGRAARTRRSGRSATATARRCRASIRGETRSTACSWRTRTRPRQGCWPRSSGSRRRNGCDG